MYKRLIKYKWYIVVILVLIIVEPAITSWLNFWVQKLYNTIRVGTSRIVIIASLLVGVSAWMGKRLLLFLISVVKSRFVNRIRLDLKHDIFQKALGMETANLSNVASVGEYISFFTNDITIIEQRYFSNIIGLITNSIRVLILGMSFFTMNYKLAIVVISFSAVVMFVPTSFSKLLNKSNLAYSNDVSVITQKIKELLSSYATIKNYSIEKKVCEIFDTKNTAVENSKFNYECDLALANSIGSLLTWFTTVAVIGTGLVLLSKGEILLGTIVAAQAFSQDIAAPLQEIVLCTNSIKSVKAIVKKAMKKTKDSDDIRDKSADIKPYGSLPKISFRNLSISDREVVIVKDFSFDFQPGKKYLVIGKNGAGKSSIFRVLKKYFKNYSGEIFIDDKNIKELSNEEISSIVSYLNERVSIFSGSLKENITFWDYLNAHNYDEVLSKAHISLDGDRELSEEACNISSGEQRRIEIARSIMSPASVLIFDEVVSTLDTETAFEIEKEALSYDDKTVIFISHNFSRKLVNEYDEILVIKDGCLIDHGKFNSLLNNCAYFKHICDIKFGEIKI